MAQFHIQHNVRASRMASNGDEFGYDYNDVWEEHSMYVEATTISAQEHWLVLADGDTIMAMFPTTSVISVCRVEPTKTQD